MSKRLEFLHALNLSAPTISLAKALELAQFVIEPGVIDLTTHEGKVAFSKVDPEIQAFVNGDRKIQAIKALREAASKAGASSGLLECKNAIDEVMPRRVYQPPTPAYTPPSYGWRDQYDSDEPPF